MSDVENPVTRIEYDGDVIRIDADILARAFAIKEEVLKRKMREGVITSRAEKGEDEDAGKVRLTFYSPKQRVRIIADEQGSILTCSTERID